MNKHPFSDFLAYDFDDPVGTSARYDAMLVSAIASGSQIELRALYGRLESVRAITGGFARAASNVLALPADDLLATKSARAQLACDHDKFERIEEIARDTMARVLEFLD